MNLALWATQALLAVAFGLVGFTKLTQPKETLAQQMGWVADVPSSTVKLIGALEVAGAAGLILPLFTGILPWLTPVAAAGLVLTMIGAMVTHVRRHEYANIFPNLVLLLLAAFIAYGRFIAVPA